MQFLTGCFGTSIASQRVLMAETNRVRSCVPVRVRHMRALESALARAAEAGDIVEIRLDCIESFEFEKA